MAVVRERALLARTLLLEIAVQAACDAGALEVGAVDRRREALADQWPDGIDPEQLLDTRSGIAARLERAVAHSEEHRRRAEEMHERAAASRAETRAMRERARVTRAAQAQSLADAHEALALLALLDADVFEAEESA